jgi:hypothetical protein
VSVADVFVITALAMGALLGITWLVTWLDDWLH